MVKRFNKDMLKKETKSSVDRLLESEARIIAEEVLQQKTNQYIDEIKSHAISIELSNGQDAQNISNTLDGDGNLYSFIGFDEGSKPVEDLIDAVRDNTNIKKIFAKNNIIRYQVSSPSLEELYSMTPMPFERGLSWLKGIEKGISGFGYYLYGRAFPNSRSGRAIQSNNRIRKLNYKPKDYFNSLYNKFIESFKR